jgi:hypothetical protein
MKLLIAIALVVALTLAVIPAGPAAQADAAPTVPIPPPRTR